MPERKPPQTRIVTSGSTIRIETPNGSRRKSKVSVVPASLVSGSVNGFVDFLREHAVIGLAIGLVIGTQVKSVVDQVVLSFINPLFKLLFGGETLNNRVFVSHFRGHEASFGWGAVVYVLIDFIFVMITIYAVIKFFKLDKLDKKKD